MNGDYVINVVADVSYASSGTPRPVIALYIDIGGANVAQSKVLFSSDNIWQVPMSVMYSGALTSADNIKVYYTWSTTNAGGTVTINSLDMYVEKK